MVNVPDGPLTKPHRLKFFDLPLLAMLNSKKNNQKFVAGILRESEKVFQKHNSKERLDCSDFH